MIRAIDDARDDPSVGVRRADGRGRPGVLLRRRPAHPRRARLQGEEGGETGMQRLNVLDFQTRIRTMPKPVIAAVNGWAVGGGHVLHVVCDLTIASDNARFMQTGPKVGSFDAGYGTTHLARIVGQKKAREIWFLCRAYSAAGGARHGPRQHRRARSADWSASTCSGAARSSPNSNIAIRMIKAAANADEDGGAGPPGAGRPRDDAVLHDRGGAGGQERLPRPPRARVRQGRLPTVARCAASLRNRATCSAA